MDDDKQKKTEEVEHDENEGEGSKSADAAYRRDVDEFLEENDPAKLGAQRRRRHRARPGQVRSGRARGQAPLGRRHRSRQGRHLERREGKQGDQGDQREELKA